MKFKQFMVPVVVAVMAFTVGRARAEPAAQPFVTQVLEPVGGSVARPRDWQIEPAHRPGVYVWTITPTPAATASTGGTQVRIETMLGVRRQGGADARERIRGILEAKARAAQVVRRCEPRDLGLFTHTCLEVIDGADRVLYSAYWETSGRNITAVLEARTTQELWPVHAATFARMMAFEVLDMKRFEE